MRISNITVFSGLKMRSLNNYMVNPFNFKGILKQDTFEIQGKNEQQSTKIDNIEARIESYKKELTVLENDNFYRENFDRILELKEKIAELERYMEQLEIHPRTAFLYNPDLGLKQRYDIAKKEGILDFHEFSKKYNIPKNPLTAYINTGKLVADVPISKSNTKPYIDEEFDKNHEFLSSVKNSLPTSKIALDVGIQYNLLQATTQKLLKNGDLKIVGFDKLQKGVNVSSALVDMGDKDNVKAFEKAQRIYPHPSRYINYIGKKGHFLSAEYLSKLGFGEVETIKGLILNGEISGKIKEEQNDKKTKIFVDVSNYPKLVQLFNRQNNYRYSLRELADKLDMTIDQLNNAVENEDLEIINEYIVREKNNRITTYVDTRTSKNQAFIKQREQELEEIAKKKAQNEIVNLKKLSNYYSLRMSIVWCLCMQTKEIGSNLAKSNTYLCSLLNKEDEGKMLTQKEKIILRTYRKKVWEASGTEEYKNAHNKANEYLKLYAEGGLEAIDNEDIKNIIKSYTSK